MRSAARQLARLVPVPRSVRPRLLDLSECPHCASPYVQPTDGKALPDGRVALTLRCPDCSSWMSGTFSAERVRELDNQLSLGRAELRMSYEQTVRVTWPASWARSPPAFARDLIGPDDFSRGPCCSYQAQVSLSPSSRPQRGAQPSSSRIRLESRNWRSISPCGVPSP